MMESDDFIHETVADSASYGHDDSGTEGYHSLIDDFDASEVSSTTVEDVKETIKVTFAVLIHHQINQVLAAGVVVCRRFT